jgi:histone-lysine N-methyltransferase SETMAR
LLEHPPYSPDLAPSDFYLFPKLKLFLAGQRFSSNQEAIAAVEYFADLTKNHYRDGIMAPEHRWNVLFLREIMLKNKNNFKIILSFFHY